MGHRPNQLIDHFLNEHSELNNRTVTLPSNLLRPLWQPFSPPTLHPPPPLPKRVDVGSALIQPIKPAMFRKNLRPVTPSSPFIASPSTSPRKQAQRQIPKEEKDKARDKKVNTDSMDLDLPEFEDIISPFTFPDDETQPLPQFKELVVWRRPETLTMDVSRPQPMRDLPVVEPPISMLYEQFARNVNKLFPAD